MNNLGNLLHDRGNNAEAETLHRKCLAVRERTEGGTAPTRWPA